MSLAALLSARPDLAFLYFCEGVVAIIALCVVLFWLSHRRRWH